MSDKCISCGAALPANQAVANCEYCGAHIPGRIASFTHQAPVYQTEAKPEVETNVRKYFSGCVISFVLAVIFAALAKQSKYWDNWMGVMGLIWIVAFALTIGSFIKWVIKRATAK